MVNSIKLFTKSFGTTECRSAECFSLSGEVIMWIFPVPKLLVSLWLHESLTQAVWTQAELVLCTLLYLDNFWLFTVVTVTPLSAQDTLLSAPILPPHTSVPAHYCVNKEMAASHASWLPLARPPEPTVPLLPCSWAANPTPPPQNYLFLFILAPHSTGFCWKL